MKPALKSPGSSKIGRGSGTFPAEIPTTATPNHRLRPSFPRNPLSPPSAPVQRRLQGPPAKSKFLAATYCANRDDAAEYASGKKWWDGTLSKNAIALQNSIGGRWLTAKHYGMGDALIFNMTLVHGSLDNRTDRIRLSTDTRYQLLSEPADERWIGERPPGHGTAMRRGRVC